MLSCKVNPKLRFLAKWHKGQPILSMAHTGSKPHTLNLHRKQAKQNLTCTGSKSNNPNLHRKQVKQSYKHR